MNSPVVDVFGTKLDTTPKADNKLRGTFPLTPPQEDDFDSEASRLCRARYYSDCITQRTDDEYLTNSPSKRVTPGTRRTLHDEYRGSGKPDRTPRFGRPTYCPECQLAVSLMERGVVPGPGGTRWHATCLICGGKGTKFQRGRDSLPGCGKRLDSAAKMDGHGRFWCQECLVRYLR